MASPAVQRHRWHRREYERAVAAGVFAPEARLELVDGEIVEMTPQGSRHSSAVRLVEEALRRAFPPGQGWDVRVQMPLALDEASEPEPDVAVVRGGPRDYVEAHPGPADTLLVVEVAEATLRWDLETKAPLYGRAGIPECWVLDLPGRRLHVMRGPAPAGWREARTLDAAGSVRPAAAPAGAGPVPVADLLP
ncbi:MAG TPA: Uma2 family endonuclease [Chromatiales bacterium]|nr:Uma2 family endonuclease [Chromatiales bacterium]